jgi:hypothetical protein
MKVMTRDQEKVLDALLKLAGNSWVLEQAFIELSGKKDVDLRQLCEAITLVRDRPEEWKTARLVRILVDAGEVTSRAAFERAFAKNLA